jgi:hypothetical protein
MSEVQFSGEARNNKVWLNTLGKLGQVTAIIDLKVVQVRESEGRVQFTIRLQWGGVSDGV